MILTARFVMLHDHKTQEAEVSNKALTKCFSQKELECKKWCHHIIIWQSLESMTSFCQATRNQQMFPQVSVAFCS